MAPTDTRPFTIGIVAGVLLVVIGIGSSVATDFASPTSLIPVGFGVVFVALGLIGRRTDRARAAAFVLGLLALLGVVGSYRGLVDLATLATGGSVDSQIAVAAQTAMVLVCLAVLVPVGLYLRADSGR